MLVYVRTCASVLQLQGHRFYSYAKAGEANIYRKKHKQAYIHTHIGAFM